MKKTWLGRCLLAVALTLGAVSVNANACASMRYLDVDRPLTVIQQEVHHLLHARDFAALDARAAQYGKSGAMTADGQEMVYAFARGFTVQCASASAADLREHEQLIEQWKQASKMPAFAALTLVHLELARAFDARGRLCASCTSDQQFSQFAQLAKQALAILEGQGEAARSYPYYYMLRMEIARVYDWDPERHRALFKQATLAFPDSTLPFESMTAALLPQWHGSRGDIVEFIRGAEAEHGKRFGPNVLYTMLHLSEKYPDSFGAGQVDRTRFDVGMKNLLARYPHPYLRNRYARFACDQGELAVAKEQLAIIRSQIAITAWENPSILQACVRAVANYQPPGQATLH